MVLYFFILTEPSVFYLGFVLFLKFLPFSQLPYQESIRLRDMKSLQGEKKNEERSKVAG